MSWFLGLLPFRMSVCSSPVSRTPQKGSLYSTHTEERKKLRHEPYQIHQRPLYQVQAKHEAKLD